MVKQRIIPLILGIMCASSMVLGICLLFASDTVSLVSGIVVACISLAVGLILADPFSIVGLLAGVCMMVFPAPAVGIILIVFGAGGGVANLIVHLKSNSK